MTAEQFIEQQLRISFKEEPGDFNIHALALKSLLIDFAKLHVKEYAEKLREGLIADGYMTEKDQLIDLTQDIK